MQRGVKGIKGLIRMSKAADNKALSWGSWLCGCRAASQAVLLEGAVHILLAASQGCMKLARAFLLHVTHVAELIFLKQSC